MTQVIENVAPAEAAAPADATTQAVRPQHRPFTIKEAFNVDLGGEVMGYDRPWEDATLRTPPRNSRFKFREKLLVDFLMWWMSGDIALRLSGHTGTGKTELVKQFHAALNLPLLMVVGTPRTEAYQLIGGIVQTAEGLGYRDAAVGYAARYGLTVLIDEYNLIDPGEATGLNAFLEGNPYTIPETGETIIPHPDFRVIVTQNPKSSGYRGRQTQDLANDDRFVEIVVPYMDAADEESVVRDEIMALGQQLPEPPSLEAAALQAKNFVEYATEVRKLFMGTSDQPNALPCTMSTRCILRWARWSIGASLFLPPGESCEHYALRRVLSGRQDPAVREALHRMLQGVIKVADPEGAPKAAT